MIELFLIWNIVWMCLVEVDVKVWWIKIIVVFGCMYIVIGGVD